jgi:hypothetical protein
VPSFPVRSSAVAATISIFLISCSKPPTATNSQAAVNATTPVDYSPRIGVAVRTNSRTCAAIKNATIQAGSPVTLVLPQSPQSFIEATISGPSPEACPITQDVVPGVSNVEISLPATSNVPKLTPMIAVLGTAVSNGFLLENISVQADLDQNHSSETFRACGANDGIHLTVWRGVPVTGTRLWSGYYYEAGNPGTLPTCGPTELLAPPGS